MIGDVVQTPAKASLSDNGIRSWDEEIKEDLDKRYPDWKEPQKTTLVPPVYPSKDDPGSLAEKKIFDLLGVMGEQLKEPMFVINSFQFSELQLPGPGADGSTKKWINGEHDIVVLHHKFGPIFMQVKAHDTHKEYKNAARQLMKDKNATAAFLKKNLGSGKLKRESAKSLFDYPGFVVMPNCPKAKSYGESGIFKEDCETVEALMAWWDINIKMNVPEGFTQEIYEHLVKRFVGCYVKIPCLHDGIEDTCNKLNFATREQWKIMRSTISCKQWITGPAGSGKTWLLQQKVVELATKSLMNDDEINQSILVLCYHRPLAQHLRNQFQIMLEDQLAQRENADVSSIINVMTYGKFLSDMLGPIRKLSDLEKKELVLRKYQSFRARVELPPCTYQHIFVDEGQDLYGIKWPELLELFLQKHEEDDDSLDSHYLWVMFDSNQNVQLAADNSQCFKKYLRTASRLTRVLRNPGNIFDVSRQYYDSALCQEITLGHRVRGLEVKWDDNLPDADEELKLVRGSALVAQHIQKLRRENVQANDICVLTDETTTRDNLSERLYMEGIPCQNAEHERATQLEDWYSDEDMEQEQCVYVESIRRFKGLESKVVILFDPTNTKTRGQLKELLYSAITRCSCLLVVVSTKSGCALISANRKRVLQQTNGAAPGKRPAWME